MIKSFVFRLTLICIPITRLTQLATFHLVCQDFSIPLFILCRKELLLFVTWQVKLQLWPYTCFLKWWCSTHLWVINLSCAQWHVTYIVYSCYNILFLEINIEQCVADSVKLFRSAPKSSTVRVHAPPSAHRQQSAGRTAHEKSLVSW